MKVTWMWDVKLDDYSKARTSARAYRNSRGNFVQSLLSRQLPLVIRGYLLRSSPRVVFQGCLRFLSCHFLSWSAEVVFQGYLLRLSSRSSSRVIFWDCAPSCLLGKLNSSSDVVFWGHFPCLLLRSSSRWSSRLSPEVICSKLSFR